MIHPTYQDLYHYIQKLYEIFYRAEVPEIKQVARLKKFLNFIGLSVDHEGLFLYHSRRAKTRPELDQICHTYLIEGGKATKPLRLRPYEGLIARPSSETPACLG